MTENTLQAIRDLMHEAWDTAESHGFHGAPQSMVDAALKIEGQFPQSGQALAALLSKMTIGADMALIKLSLIAEEVGEAVSAVRTKEWLLTGTYSNPNGDGYEMYVDAGAGEPVLKPEGLGSELADICIRVFDLAGILGIDLATEIQRKMRYNKTRPFRHGNRRA